MKKTTYKTVPAVPAKPATKKRVEKIYCDVCERDCTMRYINCVLCGREVCKYDWQRKAAERQCMGTDERDYGDYPDKYCIICHDLKFGKYDKEYEDMQEQHYKAEEALDEKIKKESLQFKP